MSKGINKPNYNDLLEDLISIKEINERVSTISLIRLKELAIQLDKMLFDRFKFINDFLLLNPTYTLEHCKHNFSQYGFNYNDLEGLKKLIQNRISFMSVKQTNTFKDLVFKDSPSQRFFTYLMDNWLKEEINKVTALRYIFSSMWFRNDNESPFKITCTQTYFAREFWNKYYLDLLELDSKNPKLNKDHFTDYYEKRFQKHLNEFQGG